MRSGRTNSCTASAANMPAAENTPDTGLIKTRRMPRSRATSTACSGPPPPKAMSARSRGSLPRSTVTARIARAMLTLATWRMPCAACRQLERVSNVLLHGAARERCVDYERAAGKRVRVKEAEHHIGVGYRRLFRATAITGWPRVAARALWSNNQETAGVDARDRAASGADFGNIDCRHFQHVAGALHKARWRRDTVAEFVFAHDL